MEQNKNKIALLVSNDKLGRCLVSQLHKQKIDVTVIWDNSSNIKRLLKLIWRRKLPLGFIIKTFIAECLRKNHSISPDNSPAVTSAQSLYSLLTQHNYQRVYMFRAGLIINKTLLNSGIEFLNVHCASVPEYGGLAAIYRALQDKRYEQHATLHKVTLAIDQGEVLKTRGYTMKKHALYSTNERVAYRTGIDLLMDELVLLCQQP